MKTWKIVSLCFVALVVLTALGYGFGWYKVFYTGTVGKAQQDVERVVFENTQSYVEGKRQEAVKYRLEYMQADSSSRQAIKMMIVQSFANFDESKLSPELQEFIRGMKYN